MDLRETYSYTSKYVRGAYLGSHTDRPSCEISATLCLDYLTDDNTHGKYGSEMIKIMQVLMQRLSRTNHKICAKIKKRK